MKPRDLFHYGCTNLFRRKTRTALTALSMAVGVMCIVVLISVGLGYGNRSSGEPQHTPVLVRKVRPMMENIITIK